MSHKINLIGQYFGKLFVLDRFIKNEKTYFVCKCECGNLINSRLDHLKEGRTVSCGCSKGAKIKHGNAMKNNISSEYKCWLSMIQRCTNIKNKSYKNYGGRGIKVCDRWLHSFENFLEDMGQRPSKNHSIDRIDVNGFYEPLNCRWVTNKEQMGNTRKNHWIEYNGQNKIIADWDRYFNSYIGSVKGMLKRGHTFEYIYNFYTKKNKTTNDKN